MGHLEKIAIIGLINLLVYWKTIYYGWVGDDVERSEREQKFKNIFHRWWLQFVGLKHRDQQVSHFITLLTHAVCCMTIYIALGHNNVSFLTAILFSVNPVNMQGSVWISGRNYVTASILALFMFIFPKLSWAFYMLTSRFAVNAWFAPLAFLGTSNWYYIGIIPLVWIVDKTNKHILHLKVNETAGIKTTNTEMKAVAVRKIMPFIKTYIYYLSLCLIPFNLGVEHTFLRGFGTNKTDNERGYRKSPLFWFGLIVFLSICSWSAWCIIKGWNPICWGLFWFTINIAMWCNFITYQQQIAERYVYLANIGTMFALANIVIGYPVIATAFVVGYSVRLFYSMDIYKNDWWAVENTLKEFPRQYYMWLMRGVKKFMDSDHRGAIRDFHEAYLHKPYDLKVLFNLSSTYFILGDIFKAREFFNKAKENIYDELHDEVKPAFDQLESLIKQVEEAHARGEKQCQVDLSRVMVVKVFLPFFIPMMCLYNLIGM
jgi:hypothetical protein